jgi:hypothetical protein
MTRTEEATGPYQIRITAAFEAPTFSALAPGGKPKDPRPERFTPGDVLTLYCLPVLLGYEGRTPFHYQPGGEPGARRYVYIPDGCWEPVNWGKAAGPGPATRWP